jgi:hypothetical protein
MMTPTKAELILFGADSDLLERLKAFSAELPWIGYEPGYGPQVVAKASLDALWATPMVGLELFGVAPPFPLHEARAHKTPTRHLQRGMPRYVIVGVATSKSDPVTPEYNLRLVLSCLLKAVKDFNSRNADQIRRIGILPEDLDLKRLDPVEAFRIAREVYETS